MIASFHKSVISYSRRQLIPDDIRNEYLGEHIVFTPGSSPVFCAFSRVIVLWTLWFINPFECAVQRSARMKIC